MFVLKTTSCYSHGFKSLQTDKEKYKAVVAAATEEKFGAVVYQLHG